MSTDTPSTGPLSGVKIVDMSTVVLGPFATQIFGDLGADVIKIEHGAGDIMRHAGRSPGEGLGPIYMGLNRNKRGVTLNLSRPKAREALERLLKDADVFFHNVRLAGMERLGFGYDAVKAINPDIIYVHCCGFAADGAYGGRQAYDDLVQAASGLADLLAIRDGGAPQYMPTLVADKTTGLYSVYATIAALFHRERSGEGQFIEVPMLESVTHFNMVENLYGRTFVPSTYGVAYTRSINPRRKPYATKDSYIAIVPYNDDQWSKFFEIGGRPGVFDDERFATYKKRTENIGALYEIIEEVATTRTTDEWLKILDEANIPAMRYN
ncbi:MAG: CoA transferase, partial [Pseudomonadota bacterium]